MFCSPQVTTELATLRNAPLLNPHFGMVIKYLDVLNRSADILLSSTGGMGLPTWLVEVQHFMKHLERRMRTRMPLTPIERTAILSFSQYWRRMVQPPYNMGRPEAQIVLITLAEFVSH
ncbi:hypothetical protein CI109_101834 [Kwoniella shandongensis]|uniref:Uncharacterized protein n=1 Tax=Kwoniella shandongensis TaxID=1734106 RepID=A0A5M6C570_9TREE|nr:uncharacterized protein CI109_001044 [Kwoniella shandongensis]KAA5530244.1 hypothetical protein CI109_001044 [Kwoniella shandongensis]